jgi:hypothetical protein
LVLAALSWDDISQPRYEDGDFAANSILIDEAMSLDLLHGNYSRTGFYHPGPALLYVQAGSQLLLHELLGLVPTPYNAHLFGVLALNASMLALAGRTLQRHTGSYLPAGFLLLTAFAYSLLFDSPGLGGLLSSTWMPHVYVWPYLLLLVSAASVSVGHAEDLWIFALAAGLLVHGHVAFVLPVLAFTAAVVIAWVVRHKGGWLRAIPLSSRIATGCTLALLVLPLALQLMTDYPGQFGEYVRYLRETDLPPRELTSIIRFVAQYWGFGVGSAALIPAVALGAFGSTCFAKRGTRRVFVMALLCAGVLATATTALYALSGVDDLTQTYLALFYVAVPTIAWTVLGTSLAERWVEGRYVMTVVVASAVVVAWFLILLQPASGSLYAGSEVGVAYDTIDRTIDDGDAVAFAFPEHNDWISTIGLLEQARRDGRGSCARTGPGIFEIVFTEHTVCDATGEYTEVLVTTGNEPPFPGADLAYEGASIRVWTVAD